MPALFQAMFVVMGVATFAILVLASLHYYRSSLGSRIDDAELALHSRRGDRFWLLGYTLLFPRPEPDPLLDRASCRRGCVALTLAGVLDSS